jgi:hypothetical protein
MNVNLGPSASQQPQPIFFSYIKLLVRLAVQVLIQCQCCVNYRYIQVTTVMGDKIRSERSYTSALHHGILYPYPLPQPKQTFLRCGKSGWRCTMSCNVREERTGHCWVSGDTNPLFGRGRYTLVKIS